VHIAERIYLSSQRRSDQGTEPSITDQHARVIAIDLGLRVERFLEF